MPKLNDIKQERLTRHQRYFKKIVISIVLLIGILTVWTLHAKYKENVRVASAAQTEIQSLRAQGDIFGAVQKMSTLSTKDFWYLWPVINQNITGYEAPFYYEFAKRFWATGDKNKAFFWTLLGRYRLNYDAYRCVNPVARDWKNYFDEKLGNETIAHHLNESQELLDIILKDVLAWDVDSIIASNPDYLCAYASAPSNKAPAVAPKTEWVQIHRYLRLTTANFVQKKDKKAE